MLVRASTVETPWPLPTFGVGGNLLDKVHPIQQIAISCGWIVSTSSEVSWGDADMPLQVDGITVTYQLSEGGSFSSAHGSVFSPPSNVVSFGCELVLCAMHFQQDANL